MKIGIDARMLGAGYGIGRYVEQLILHLAQIDEENEYVLFLSSSQIKNEQLIPTCGRDPAQGETVSKNFKKVLAGIPWYGWSEQIKFKKIIQREKVDLMHFPHWNVPLLYNEPFVVTIHDLIMFHYPRQEASTLGPISYWFKDLAHRLVIRHAVKSAKRVIVPSEFTKQDVRQTLNVPMEKMVVTYQAPFESKNEVSGEQNFGINKPYVLYVGAAYPHKNLQGLLKAWEIFEEKYGLDYQLVLAGKENYFYKRLKSTLHNFKSVIYTGFVSDQDLVNLYSNASLYVFPSLYEGFGLPPLEAFAHGVPVVSSNRSSLPEVLGEGALYFDPDNYEQMADTIRLALVDKNIQIELKQKANQELKRYSWQKLAKETLEVYKRSKNK